MVISHCIRIKCNGTVVDTYQIVALDGGRYSTPIPEWGFLGRRITENGPEFSYKYFIKDSFRYSLHKFMYHEENDDERYAYDDFISIILVFNSIEEKNNFDEYVEYHIEKLRTAVDNQTEYSCVKADSDAETRFVIHRLRTALVLQCLLKEFRSLEKL